MPPEERTVEVWASWRGLPTPLEMGLLRATRTRGKHILSFVVALHAVCISNRVKPRRAAEILDEVVAAVWTWRGEAKRLKLTRAAQDAMAAAFSAAEA